MNETFVDAIPTAAVAVAELQSTLRHHTPSTAAMSEGASFEYIGTTDGYIFAFKDRLVLNNCYFTGIEDEIVDIFINGPNSLLIHQKSQLLYANLPQTVHFISAHPVPQTLDSAFAVPLNGSYKFRPKLFSEASYQAIGYNFDEQRFYLADGQELNLLAIESVASEITDFLVVDDLIIAQDSNILVAYSNIEGEYLLSGILDCRKSILEGNFLPVHQREPIQSQRSLYCAIGPSYHGARSYGHFVASQVSATDPSPRDFSILVQYSATEFADINIELEHNNGELARDLRIYKKALADCGITDNLEDVINCANQVQNVVLMYKIPGFETQIKQKQLLRALCLYRSRAGQTFGLISDGALVNALLYETNCYYEFVLTTQEVAAADIRPLREVVFCAGHARLMERGARCLVAVKNIESCVYLFADSKSEQICQFVPYLTDLAQSEAFVEREDEFDIEPDERLPGPRYCDIVADKMAEIRGRLPQCPEIDFSGKKAAEQVFPL